MMATCVCRGGNFGCPSGSWPAHLRSIIRSADHGGIDIAEAVDLRGAVGVGEGAVSWSKRDELSKSLKGNGLPVPKEGPKSFPG
jgi:hypothetical protein